LGVCLSVVGHGVVRAFLSVCLEPTKTARARNYGKKNQSLSRFGNPRPHRGILA